MRWILLAIKPNNNIKDMKYPPISWKIKDINNAKTIKQRIQKMIVFHFFTLYLKREKFPIEWIFSFHKITANLIIDIMLIIKKVIAIVINISKFQSLFMGSLIYHISIKKSTQNPPQNILGFMRFLDTIYTKNKAKALDAPKALE